MNTFAKYASAAALVGALAVPAASPSMARGFHHHHGFGAAAGVGFAAGALVGAAAANAYAPNYYEPGYAYAPAYGAYAYEPGVAYAPERSYGNYGLTNEQACTLSPGSINYVPCYNHE